MRALVQYANNMRRTMAEAAAAAEPAGEAGSAAAAAPAGAAELAW